MRRVGAGLDAVAEMWCELLGLGAAGWQGVAACLTLAPLAVLITPVTFAAGVVRGR
jgi:hypothetical protein